MNEYIPIIVAALALFFTIGSFYWMNWRKGKLIIGPPSAYGITSQNGLTVDLPFIFFNDGATTKIIHNLRLTLEQNGNKSPVLDFNIIYMDFTIPNKPREYTRIRQFAIKGGEAYSGVFSFHKKPCNFIPAVGKCNATLEMKSHPSSNWEPVLAFDLNIWEKTIEQLGRNVAYDNNPDKGEDVELVMP